MKGINSGIFAIIILAIVTAGITHAAEGYDFSCETPVAVTEQFDGEIKYNCIVKNTGDSFLELYYEAQPESNPIDPRVAVGFHPQPPKIFLEAKEEQPIVGFEVPPRVPAGENEIRFTRIIAVYPATEFKSKVTAKEITITTIVKSQPLNDETKISGKILDARTGQPIADAEIFFKYRRFERKSRTSPNGEYNSNVPALQYLMMVQAKGYELFSQEINLTENEEVKMDISLNKVRKIGSYDLVKKLKLEPGAWQGVWRSAVSNDGQYVAFGMGGERIKTDSFEGYFYLFKTSGEQILKVKTVDEVRGIAVSPDGSFIAVSLGYGKFGKDAGESFEKVLLFRKNGELVWKKYLKDNAFHEIKFSHNGMFVAVGDTEGYVYLLDATDGREIWKKFTRGQVRAIQFYDDDSHLLVGSGDNYVHLFDINGNEKWKAYVHSWPYGFIATTPGNEFSAAGGHVGYLHILDKNGKDIWAYEADGGFRWAEIGPDASFAVGGTRSELAFLDAKGTVLWKGYDAVSGAMTKDKKYIISGNQRGELELRNTNGTILWEYRTGEFEPGKDVRFSHVSDDATIIVGAVKTGEVYFFGGTITEVPLEVEGYKKEETNTKMEDDLQPPPIKPKSPVLMQEIQPKAEEEPKLQSDVPWASIAVGAVVLLALVVLYITKRKK